VLVAGRAVVDYRYEGVSVAYGGQTLTLLNLMLIIIMGQALALH